MKAFINLEQALTSCLIPIYPNFEEPFMLTTDANAFRIGAVLSQGPVGKQHVDPLHTHPKLSVKLSPALLSSKENSLQLSGL